MATLTATPPVSETAEAAALRRPRTGADWHASIGYVPLERVIFDPPPGQGTAAIAVTMTERGLGVECVDGTLVEKTMGHRESRIAAEIIRVLGNFVREHKLGVVAGADGLLRMSGGNIRIPDVSFTRNDDLPSGGIGDDPAPTLPPTLAVEVLSPGNTVAEMQLKLEEYFASGSKLVWFVEPADRTVRIYESPTRFRQIDAEATLDGGQVLPGFEVKVADLFDV